MLNPLLLWGAALGAIPVIIHLLNKRRYRPVTWAAMEFLVEAIRKNARRLQLRDIILMLIRTAAVIFLALALARPTVAGKSFIGGSKTGAVILLDNSMSMGYHNGTETRFEVAKKLAKSVLAQLEPGSWCGLYTFNTDAHAPLGEPSQNMAYVEHEIDNENSVRLSDGATNVEKPLERAQKIFDQHREFKLANREVYLITDMQARAWQEREVSGNFRGLLKNLSSTAGVYLVNAGDTGAENVAVMDLSPADTQAVVDMPITFVARVKNFGQNDVKGLTVDFYINPGGPEDKPAQRSTINIAAGETSSVNFEAKFATGGDQRVKVKLADDHLAGDNQRFCSVEVIDEARILLADGRDLHGDDPLANETGFLRFALSPHDPENPDKQSVIATEVVSHFRLADKNLLNYQALVLANVAKPDISAATIEQKVKAGMGLMVFLGDQIDPKVYNALLGDGGAKLLPAVIGNPWGEAPSQESGKVPPAFSFASDRDKLSHPIMSDFNSPEYAELLSRVKTYRAFELEVPKDPAVRVVAYFSNGKPAIIEKKVGTGVVLLFAFPATTAWSNLPTQPTFAILMLRAASTLAIGNRPPKNLTVGAPIRCDLPLADQGTQAIVTPPPPGAKKETRPEVTPEGRARIEFAETEHAGFYDVALERTPPLSMSYALNPDAEAESNLNTITPDELRRLYPEFKFGYIAKSDDLGTKLASERRGSELWPWLIALVFMLLAAESILATHWAPRD